MSFVAVVDRVGMRLKDRSDGGTTVTKVMSRLVGIEQVVTTFGMFSAEIDFIFS